MATKTTTGGLFSKMVKFVRHPTRDWSELDSVSAEPEVEAERGYSKQSLKEMIERKRQNDFVRQREFDELRKLRRNVPVISADSAGRPSFFQNTTTNSNLEERAQTIKKIDDIEAQMSKQWWTGRQGDSTVPPAASPVPVERAEAQEDMLAASVGANDDMDPLATLPPPETEVGSSHGPVTHFDQTRPGAAETVGMAGRAATDRTAALRAAGARQTDAGLNGFSSSKLFSIELDDSLADTDMEEAAIRFANGDDAGAEACLLTALNADNVRPAAVNGCAAALFDLYRATGQQEAFDRNATEYARRFGYTAPGWFSTPDLLGQQCASAAVEPVAISKQTAPAIWEAPGEIDLQTLQDLRASLSRTPEPWHLNWSRFRAIRPEAGEVLADLFAHWCAQPVILHFEGADALEKTLRSFTPSGNKSVAMFWWRLRLDALRVLRLQDEFELAALDFCVTYEVSPPPWQSAKCQCAVDQAGPARAHGEGDEWDVATVPGAISKLDHAATEPMDLDAISASVIELSGEVMGDATDALNKLQGGLSGANRLVISCDRLIRVDFSAAGSILNWVAAREAEGCHVQFRDVPRLVAAFFNVIGISEHARVMLRTS